eukprot:gene21603-28603_t
MARSVLPYIVDTLQGNYSIHAMTDFLIRVLAGQGINSLATGRLSSNSLETCVQQGTQHVIDLVCTKVLGSSPCNWTPCSDDYRQISVVVPLLPALAVQLKFDLM